MPPWRLLQKVTLLWFGCFVAATLLDGTRWVLSPGGLVEGVGWLVVLSALANVPALRAFLGVVPRPHRRLIAATVAAMLFGQLMGWRSERTFPLVSWRMFGWPAELKLFSFFEVLGITEAGAEIRVNPARLFPSLKNYRMAAGLSQLAERVAAAPASAERSAADERTLSAVLRAVGLAHNRRGPHPRIRAIALARCQFDPRAGPSGRRVGTARLRTVALSESGP